MQVSHLYNEQEKNEFQTEGGEFFAEGGSKVVENPLKRSKTKNDAIKAR